MQATIISIKWNTTISMQRHKCTTFNSLSIYRGHLKLIMLVAIKKNQRDTITERNKNYLKIFHLKLYFPYSICCVIDIFIMISLSDFILDEFSPNRRHVSIANICTQPPFVQWNDFWKCIFFSCHMVMTMSIEHKEH